MGPCESVGRDKRTAQPTGVNLQGGNRLSVTTAPGRKCLNGRDHNGLP